MSVAASRCPRARTVRSNVSAFKTTSQLRLARASVSGPVLKVKKYRLGLIAAEVDALWVLFFKGMADKRRSPCTMSLKAHAFSVEALIGAEKRRKLDDEDSESCFGEENEVASLAGSACGGSGGRNCDTDCDASRKFFQ